MRDKEEVEVTTKREVPSWVADVYDFISSVIGAGLGWAVLLVLFFAVFTAFLWGLYLLVNFILRLVT